MHQARQRLVDARQFLEAAELLKRALDRKTQAGYESVDVSMGDAESCLRWARQLLAAAEARLQS